MVDPDYTLHSQSNGTYLTTARRDGRLMTWGEVVDGWAHDAAFRERWREAVLAVPHRGYCWETPVLNATTALLPFECVFVPSPALADKTADPSPFAEQLRRARPASVARFFSLGRDAELIAPCPLIDGVDHTHLAAFVRTAPREQVDALWQSVGEAAAQALAVRRPVWVSTAGLGVSWLHVRLDARPKYYRHAPYR